MGDVLVPQFARPLRLGAGGDFAYVEQDSDEDVLQSVAVLIDTPLGKRLEQPDYGVDPMVFEEAPIDISAITNAVNAWEPRASVDPSVVIDSADELLEYVQVAVSD
jgi:phage baseplate assembly protein W